MSTHEESNRPKSKGRAELFLDSSMVVNGGSAAAVESEVAPPPPPPTNYTGKSRNVAPSSNTLDVSDLPPHDSAKISIALCLNGDYFHKVKDLASIAATCKELCASVMQPQVWTPFLRPDRVGFPLHDSFDDSEWDNPHIPKGWDVFEMNLPGRRTGEKIPRAYYQGSSHMMGDECALWHPHPDDKEAKGLLLAPKMICPSPPGRTRFDPKTGVLEDLFFRKDIVYQAGLHQGADYGERVWVARPLPICCDACNVTCHSYLELVEHCKQYQHVSASKTAGEKIPEKYVDPRHKVYYVRLPAHEKVMVLSLYKRIVIGTLMMMDRDGLDAMQGLLDWIVEHVRGSNAYDEDALEKCTLERVTKYCMFNFAIGDFLKRGMAGYALDVCKNGWEHFDLHGSSSSNMLFEAVVHGD